MADSPKNYGWKRIEDLPENWRTMAHENLHYLKQIWIEQAVKLRESEAARRFQERLCRQWAIETGVIEGLYKIDRGVAEMLIEHGIESSLIPHGSTDRPTEEVVTFLHDHQNVLEGLFDFVSAKKPLSTFYIRQLHQAFCRHQETVTARDTFDRLVEVPLLRGEWKKQPNNPSRQNGTIHQYCPPEHVESEMVRLVEMHLEHVEKGVPAEVEAAWLHHRFAQIHPFQDGNGRVARALATLVLLRGRYFPFVVDRQQRAEYISVLEVADRGDISEFVHFIAAGQKASLVKALSLSEEVLPERKAISALVEDATSRLREHPESVSEISKNAFQIAGALQELANNSLHRIVGDIHDSLQSVDNTYDCMVIGGHREGGDSSFDSMVERLSEHHGYVANTRRYTYRLCLLIREKRRTGICLWFHAIGKPFHGVMGVGAFLQRDDKIKSENMFSGAADTMLLSDDLFVFSYLERTDKAAERFLSWLDNVILIGLDEWRRSL